VSFEPEALVADPPPAAAYGALPPAAAKAQNFTTWTRQLTDWMAANESLSLMKSPSTKQISQPDESERDFRARLQHTSREGRDSAVDGLRKKYAPKLAALEEKLRRAQQTVERETEQASGQKLQTAISFGATLVGAFLGRKAISASTLGRATTAARGIGRAQKESQDVARAQETVEAIEEQRKALEESLRAETAALETAGDITTEALDTISMTPAKSGVRVRMVALLWR
jgi:hypothetical protein